MGDPLARTLTRSLRAPPAALWPLLADTARFNEAFGLPKHQIIETPRPDGSVEFRGRLKKGWLRLEWLEVPVNWVTEQWFEHRRDFVGGPFRSLTAALRMTPEGGGCRVDYSLEVAPRGLLGRLLAGKVVKAGLANAARAMSNAEAKALGQRDSVFDYRPPPVAAPQRRRVESLVERIEASGHGHGLAARLADEILSRQEVDLVRLRPLALARRWQVKARDAVELCLQGTRDGLLTLKWSLLCPRCRVGKLNVGALDELPTGAHCPSCNIDYDRDFARNVELAFEPAPAVRAISQGEYCLFGPMSVAHVKLQLRLAPGESRRLPCRLAPGPYRVRTLEPGPQRDIEVAEALPHLVATGAAIEAGAPAGADEAWLENRADRTLTLVIEERAWVADALTAERATTFQAFRDLFSEQVLRPGDEVAVKHVTLMFTDLRASTALYGRIGDARAYTLVRDHFAFLTRLVREHDGAIVKTIGDAIMAAFSSPADGVRAALAIQRAVGDFNRAHGEALAIKLGLHGGPCIAVTLNQRLDYFGTTANLAARLGSESGGEDVVLSAPLAADPEVQQVIAGIPASSEAAKLKGFDAPVAFLRLTP
jgi:class 3 adenylate cyclase